MKKGVTERPERPAGRTAWAMLLVCALFLPVLSGCTKQEGRPISDQNILAIKVGKTTEKEVLKIMGPPEEKTRLLGEDLWTYRHLVSHGVFSTNTDIKVLRIRFDENGVVRDVEQKRRKYQRLF